MVTAEGPLVEWGADGCPTGASLSRLRELVQEHTVQAMRAFYAALREVQPPYGRCGLETVEVRGETMNLFGYHTGGWSGHEAVISVLRESWLWGLLLERYESGGHYYFKHPRWCAFLGEEQEEEERANAHDRDGAIEWDANGYPTHDSLLRLERAIVEGRFNEAASVFYRALQYNRCPERCGPERVEVGGKMMDVWGYHTDGWRGNEAIIKTLSRTWLFMRLLARYDWGGHYYFRHPRQCVAANAEPSHG